MLGWGTSDFLANSSADQIGHRRTLFWSQLAGLGLVFLGCLILQPWLPLQLWQLALVICLGVIYALAYSLFYQGFEKGNVSVVSAVINLQTVFIVGISFFLRGQQLSLLQWPALGLILLGITLVSVKLEELHHGGLALLNGVKETLLSAVLFGVLYWPLSEVLIEQTNFLLVTLLVKVVAILTVVGMAWRVKSSLLPPVSTTKLWLTLTAVGLLEAVGVLSVNLGMQYGDAIIVAPIASALTVVTISLAVIFLKERLSRVQVAGIVLTMTGILLTTLS